MSGDNASVWFALQRKRHYWVLDGKSITMYQNENSSKYYKVSISKQCKWKHRQAV